MASKTEFDVALSFAGEQREYVKQVYDALIKKGVRPYYDEAETEKTLGANLVDHFSDIFGKKARFCVMFISKDYVEKPWTNFERQFIEERQLYEQGYIIPVRFDNAELKGLPGTIGYVKANQYNPQELADLIALKVLAPTSIPNTSEPTLLHKQPRLKPKTYNVYKERDRWLETVLMELEGRETDDRLDITVIRYGTPGVRLLLDGKVLWAFNFVMGGHGGDASMSISSSRDGQGLSNNSLNAYGEFEWDRTKSNTVFAMIDLSFLSGTMFSMSSQKLRFTAAEFVEVIWDKIIGIAEGNDQ